MTANRRLMRQHGSTDLLAIQTPNFQGFRYRRVTYRFACVCPVNRSRSSSQ
jgi:hypothetical protein